MISKSLHKIGLILALLAGFANRADAQTGIANYSLAINPTGTYTPIIGTTFVSGTYDNNVSTAITMGGTFNYGGVNFAACFISANGFITFGAAPSGMNYTPLSTLGTTTGAIAAYAQDAGSSTATGATPLISYLHTGSEFVVQYADHANYYGAATERLNFQIRLTYATGAINIVYGTWTNPNATATSGLTAQVGLRGNSTAWATNVNNLRIQNTPTGTTCNWSNAVTGNANSSTMLFSNANNNIKPTSGLTYTWTPQSAPAPVQTFAAPTAITNSGATVSWTAPTGATQYNLQYRVPGTCTWTNFSGNPVTGATAMLTGLNAGTSYQVRVQASNGTNNSIWSHLPTGTAGAGTDGYTTTGHFTTLANACSSASGGTAAANFTSRCDGQTVVLTSTGATTGETGISYQWKVASTAGGPYSNVTGGSGGTTTSYTSAALTPGTYYYVLQTTCANGPVVALSNEVMVTVNVKPTVTVSPATSTYCTGATAIPLTAGGATSYTWTPSAGLSATTGAAVDASPTASTVYTVTGTDGNGCTNTAVTVLNVFQTPVFGSVTATPATICANGSSQLQATLNAASYSVTGYSFAGTSDTYSPITGTTLGAAAIGDDVGVGNLPIGFPFNYHGVPFSVFAARSNGLIELGNTTAAPTGFSSNALATTANTIAPLWDDNNTTGGSIIYATTGTSPNRVLTVQWTGMHVGNSGSPTQPTINMQVQLFEGTNEIKFIYGSTSAALTSTTASIGISGTTGTYLSVTPLSPANTSTVSSAIENASISSATNFPTGTVYTFTPPAITYAWTPATYLDDPSIANPLASNVPATQSYAVTASSSNGCVSAPGNVTINVSSGVVITAQPAPLTRCVGTAASFSVTATGAGLTYQWQLNGIDIPAASNPTAITSALNLTNVMTADAGTYTVVISSSCGAPVTSDGVAILTVNPIPTATASNDGPKCAGSTVNLTGTTDIGTTFAWTGPNSFTSTSQNPVISSTTAANAGTYSFIATANGCSSPAATTTVVINNVPVVLMGTNYSICPGSTIPSGQGIAATSNNTVTSFTGSLAGPGTYVRSLTGTTYSAATTTNGNAVFYSTHTFTVSATGSYTFNQCAPTYDAFASLYTNFNPSSPATGFIAADDDVNGTPACSGTANTGSDSRITANLTAGTTYTYVSSSYANAATGAYTIGITGAGNIISGPATINWYTAATGGSSIGTGSPFDPIGVAGSGLANSNTAGNYVFYAEGNNGTCPSATRTPVTLNIRGGVSNASLATTSTNTVTLPTASCGDDNGWTYYTDPADPSKYLFGINWDPTASGTMNAAAKASATARLQLDGGVFGVDDGATQGTWVMRRYWNVDLGGATLDGPVNMRFFYDMAEKTATDNAASAFQSAHPGSNLESPTWFKTVGTDYANDAAHVNEVKVLNAIPLTDVSGGATLNGVTYAEFDGITSFSGGSYASGVGIGTPLPVVLKSIAAQNKGAVNVVNWTTSVENAVNAYEVQRSADGKNFSTFATQKATGAGDYTATDNAPVKGINYYRLRILDANGKEDMSRVVTAIAGSSSTIVAAAYPNPVTDMLTVATNASDKAVVTLLDLTGRIVETQTVAGGKAQFNMSRLSSGMYTVIVTDGGNKEVIKVTKQ